MAGQAGKTKKLFLLTTCVALFFSAFLNFARATEISAENHSPPQETFEDPFAAEPDGQQKEEIYDPLESWNRFVFEFNDFFYLKILDPAARGYQFLTPRELRRGVSNFFSNLSEPIYFVNALMQGEGSAAHTAFARFLVNSTFGLGGLFDVVGSEPEQDPRYFDQTLARWGVGQGIYIVWPLRGPATLRSSFGWAGDSTLDPSWHVHPETWAGATAVYNLNEAPAWINEYERMKQHMLDPYSGVKNAYIENTRYRFEK